MPETIEKEIGGITFVLTPFGARKGISIFTRLVKLVDLGELDKSAVEASISGGVLLELLAAVQHSISPSVLSEFLDEFERSCQWKNDTGQLLPLHKHEKVHHADRIFARNYDAWLAWCWWILEENFSSFFTGIKVEENPLGSQSKSPPT